MINFRMTAGRDELEAMNSVLPTACCMYGIWLYFQLSLSYCVDHTFKRLKTLSVEKYMNVYQWLK